MALLSEALLREKFSLPGFRRGQQEIIASILGGQDVMAVLPTGGGKSLCYQYPAVAAQKLVVVISPLIALMKDQVSNLNRLGIPAGALHSGQTEADAKEVFRKIGLGGPFLLYLSPERAQKEGFHRWIKGRPIALFAIDEAHCVSQWGHDFREEYGLLSVLKTLRPDVPVLALTASATPQVLSDIARVLQLKKPSKHVHGFYRPNLYYQVESCQDEADKLRYLEQGIQQNPEGRIIVYCGTRRSTEEVAESLGKKFSKVGYYHAGLSPKDRNDTQTAYEEGEIRILVATNAFGMGIDHPDVRLVMHYQMPANIDSLYQEMGRAGRDGKDSTCLMLYSKKDKGLQSYFITQSEAPAEIKRSRWSTLDALVSYSEGGECRHSGILTYYHDSQRIESCGHCDACVPNSNRRVLVTHAPKAATTRRRNADKKAVPADEGLSELEQMRFAALKEWRRLKAKELDTAAFVVFSDRTLRHLAAMNPQSREQLLEVYGIGEAKVEAFGTEVLEKLNEF
jgi:ATP-dependent DNA helicase RecQ